MTVLLGVIVLFAVLALAMAVWQAMAIVRLSPAGTGLSNSFLLGWWKFPQIAARISPEARAHLDIYKRAVIAFVVFVILGVVLSGWLVNAQRPGQDVAMEPRLIQDFRTVPAQFVQSLSSPAHLVALTPELAEES